MKDLALGGSTTCRRESLEPTHNKQMSLTMLIFKQNLRSQTPITTIPSLQIRTTHNNTTQLFNCTNINTQPQVTNLLTAPVEEGHLLVEWRWATSQPAGPDSGWMCGYHRSVCVETVVGPLHHCLIEGWGRQQQHHDRSYIYFYQWVSG